MSCCRFARQLMSVQVHGALGRLELPAQHAEQCRFSGAIWTEQREAFAWSQFERHTMSTAFRPPNRRISPDATTAMPRSGIPSTSSGICGGTGVPAQAYQRARRDTDVTAQSGGNVIHGVFGVHGKA